MDINDDIYRLRQKSNRITGNKNKKIYDSYSSQTVSRNDSYRHDSYENDALADRQAGFIMRTIVCLCMLIAFILCRLGNTAQSSQVFRTVSSGISQTQSIDDMKNTVMYQIKKILN